VDTKDINLYVSSSPSPELLGESFADLSFNKYWNWFRHTDNEHANPVFDGSDTSLGGDGEFVAHNGSLAGARLISLPSGQGGGCIKSGPFKK